ncbi:hypothetical protein EJ110_NYTH13206 [Nymphaea thermarum]|nr:hypothetical protein EJ110_NYTH13206 [Nymphaea thermarum]
MLSLPETLSSAVMVMVVVVDESSPPVRHRYGAAAEELHRQTVAWVLESALVWGSQVQGLVHHRCTYILALLLGPIGDAVVSVIHLHIFSPYQTFYRLPIEVVGGECKVLQCRQRADVCWNKAGKCIARNVELFDSGQAGKRGRQAGQGVGAHVEHSHILQQAYLLRQASGEATVQQYDLIQPCHLPNASGNATTQLVVCNNHNGSRGISEIFRDVETESIVVKEDRIQILLKKLRRNGTLEIIESDIHILEIRNGQ